METQEQFFKESGQKIEQYVQDRLLLLKLKTVEKISKLVAVMFAVLVVAVLVFFIFLFLSIMAGYYFAELTNSMFLGFGIVSAFYIIILVTLIALRKSVLERMITNTVINILFEDKDGEDDNDSTNTTSTGHEEKA